MLKVKLEACRLYFFFYHSDVIYARHIPRRIFLQNSIAKSSKQHVTRYGLGRNSRQKHNLN